MSGNKTIATSETRIEAISLQSSSYGVTVPLVYGMNRIAGNMIWYGGFKATPHVESQSGKGGGVKTQNTTFSYSASVMMGLCEGKIIDVPRVWKGKVLNSGGWVPTQITTAIESYVVPGSGAMTLTVAHSATYLSLIAVGASMGGEKLAQGSDFTMVGGLLTVLDDKWRGRTLFITYQYATGTQPATALQKLGLSFLSGEIGQATWAYLSSAFPAQAIGYSGLALVYAQDYQLGNGAQVENHTFEIQGPQSYSVSSSIPDANPALAAFDAITNARYGAAFPAAQYDTTSSWSDYCLAAGIFMSPALETQMKAAEFVAKMGSLTNTAPVWSGGVLKFIPYGDTALAANGATYTPNLTPVYDLTDDDFTPSGSGSPPITVTRKPQADAYNHIRVEFRNRGVWDGSAGVHLGGYNIEVAEAKDSANIDIYGLRSAEIFSAHWICDAAIARTVAQLLLQRSLYVRNTYEFTLPWTKALLEPMDLVTLTDSGLGLAQLPVRITQISESESGDLSVTAEDFPAGVATAALYPTQAGAGVQHDFNASPGAIGNPVIFERPGALTQNGLEVCVAATGLGAMWGGFRLWVSLDGTNYKEAGVIYGGSRYGTLTADASVLLDGSMVYGGSCYGSHDASDDGGGTLSVVLHKGVLTSGTVADALALNTLCYIGGASPEFMAYHTAALTSALHYDLAGTPARGAYGTPAAAHASGVDFVRVDEAVAKSGPLDLSYVGKTIHIKCTSFNVYGAAEESLDSVVDYTYTITGSQVYGNAGAQALAGITAASSDNILTAGEKPPRILDYATILADQGGIDAQAAATGFAAPCASAKAAYDTAVSALTTYLGTLTTPVAWNVLTGDTDIVGTTFRSKFADVYATRQALLNIIAATAATMASWGNVTGVNVQTGQIAPGAATEILTIPAGTATYPAGWAGGPSILDGVVFTPSADAVAEVTARVDGSASTGSEWGAAYFGLACIGTGDITADDIAGTGNYLFPSGYVADRSKTQGLSGASTTRASYTLNGRFPVVAGQQYRVGVFYKGANPDFGIYHTPTIYVEPELNVTLIKR